MLNFVSKVSFVLLLVVSISNAVDNNTQDIIDVVDYKINRIQTNIGSDLDKIKQEIAVLKITQNDQSIEDLKTNVVQATKSTKSLEEEFSKYDTMINSSNRDIKTWIIAVFVIVAFMIYYLVQNYLKNAKKEISIEAERLVEKTIQKYKKEQSLKNKVTTNSKSLLNKIESEVLAFINSKKNRKMVQYKFNILRNKYHNTEVSKKILFDELKTWIKTFEDKKMRKKITNFLETSKI